MNLKLNGTSISNYVAESGYTIQRKYVKLGKTVKTLDGVIHPAEEKEFVTLIVPIVGVSSSQYASLFSLITKPTVSVTYDDPHHGLNRVITCTSKDNSSELLLDGVENTDWWDGLVLQFDDCG